MTAQELAINNSEELLEFFKDKWSKEEYEHQLLLQEIALQNKIIMENTDD